MGDKIGIEEVCDDASYDDERAQRALDDEEDFDDMGSNYTSLDDEEYEKALWN